MTAPLDLAAIKARAEAATAGPWHRVLSLMGGYWTLGKITNHAAHPLREDADWTFAEHAREDVPALVARVEALEAALREIAVGKTAADIGHPLGEGWLMAGRFVSIAQRALGGEP